MFFIYPTSIDVTLPNGESGTLDCSEKNVPSWSGTGFLLENGTFVTARHVIEAWNFWMNGNNIDEELAQLNAIMNNGGKVKAHFVTISSSGKRINLTSDQFAINRTADQVRHIEDGVKMSMGGVVETPISPTLVLGKMADLPISLQVQLLSEERNLPFLVSPRAWRKFSYIH